MTDAVLTTPWEVDQPIPWPEYPRPQMRRSAESWFNLNGIWSLKISKGEQAPFYAGQIQVPFPPESQLSGVGHILQPDEKLEYSRQFQFEVLPDERYLLHFGAVDYLAHVTINGASSSPLVHRGGFLPFTFEITDRLVSGENSITVDVFDPTDRKMQQRGKQVLKPRGIYYTSVSGIWQTVWIERVAAAFIRSLRITPDFDLQSVEISAEVDGRALDGLEWRAEVSFEGRDLVVGKANAGETLTLAVPEMHAWHPDHPHLYDLRIQLLKDGSVVDEIESYFAMRKFGRVKDEKGYWRFALNNEELFLYGPLDQGYWPEGLFTPPSEEAMIWDLEYTKAIGCNMVRKHVKVEPLSWYSACDRLGLIVWQDMPNGGKKYSDVMAFITIMTGYHRNDRTFLGRYGRQHAEDREEFERELKIMMDTLYNHPCIAVWVPFNESWGQFESLRIAKWISDYDSSRLVDHASGWFDQGGGDFQSRHVYFKPLSARQPDHRILVVSEFGGFSLPVHGHMWDENKKFGYRYFEESDKLQEAYLALLKNEVEPLIPLGLAGAIYTQTTDIESEVNGYLTYDRKVQKMDAQVLREAHEHLINWRQAQ